MIRNLKNIFKSGKAQVNPGWLFFFRINSAGFALLHFLSIQPDFSDLYSYQGYVYPDILDAYYDHLTPTITSLQSFLQKIRIPISYETLLTTLRIAYPVFLILLILGVFTRVTAIFSLLLQLILAKSIHLYQYGVDFFTTIVLFYCCVFPVGKVYSIDKIIFRRMRMPVNHRLFLQLLQWHLCIAYFFSGLDKIIGQSWRNGEAIWKALHAHNYYSLFSLDFFSGSLFFILTGWFTMILEMGYTLFMNIPATRKYWLTGILGMHVFIAFFMGLFFFSALMIILNLSAFYVPYIRNRELAISNGTLIL
jgi:hypothetical protein